MDRNAFKLQYITFDTDKCSHAELAEEACKGGVRWIQLRVKNKSLRYWTEQALATQEICKKHNAVFIINDNIELAKEIKADGVHLGKNDTDPDSARAVLGDDYIIGCTANSFEDIAHLSNAKIDYLGVGPFRFTSTKKNLSPVLGLDGYKTICAEMKQENITLPFVAIGGIKSDDISDIMKTGANGIAISSVITDAENRTSKAQELYKIIEKY